MEQSRLNRPCVIPDYTGAEVKALLRDPLHTSITITKLSNCTMFCFVLLVISRLCISQTASLFSVIFQQYVKTNTKVQC